MDCRATRAAAASCSAYLRAWSLVQSPCACAAGGGRLQKRELYGRRGLFVSSPSMTMDVGVRIACAATTLATVPKRYRSARPPSSDVGLSVRGPSRGCSP